MELELVTLENNKTCIILDKIIYNNNEYLYLVDSQNKKDFTIRKIINDELVGLKNEEEFNNIINIFINNHIKEYKTND